MYFNDVRMDHPGHAIVQKMVEVARLCGIGQQDGSTLNILIDWSTKVKEDFVDQSVEIPKDSGATLALREVKGELASLEVLLKKFAKESITTQQNILLSPALGTRNIPERDGGLSSAAVSTSVINSDISSGGCC